MKTKNYLSIISILFFSFLFVSCSKEDEGDTIKPVIDLLEPEEGAILRIGSSHGVHFEMNLHDNEAIASYKINIHNNFDGHSQGPIRIRPDRKMHTYITMILKYRLTPLRETIT